MGIDKIIGRLASTRDKRLIPVLKVGKFSVNVIKSLIVLGASAYNNAGKQDSGVY